MEISTKLPSGNEYHVPNVDCVITGTENSDSSDEKNIRGSGFNQHRKTFIESDSDMESVTLLPINNISKKSRIKINSDTDSDSELPIEESSTTISKSSRIKNKKIKLYDKFKKLKTPHSQIPTVDSNDKNHPNVSGNDNSDKSDEEISCLKIKKKIMKKKNTLSSICDADTSDDDIESSLKNIKKQRKTTSKSLNPPPSTQPKMSTKQAMENMQKIKSESNRMLREKDVSLPYHKPRALSLQDIINRKKPTLTSDGKAMPIKMNSEQLVQYVKLLEERQKEMIELCKSESEEETLPENSEAQENSHVEQESDSKASNNKDNQDTDQSLSDQQFDDIPQINIEVNTENNCVDYSVEPNSPEKILIDNDSKCCSNEQIQEAYQDCPYMDSEGLILASESEKALNECDNLVEGREENCLINDDAKNIIETDNSKVSNEQKAISNDFSEDDNDFNLQDIDKIIENAEIIEDATQDTNMSVKDQSAIKPKLTGTPGMFIDLESGDQFTKVLTGVELLKERYTYFSKLKSLEDQEKNRNQKHKPGIQHLKLKHELEEQIAEQRSLEWEKRLEDEKQIKSEMVIEPDDNIEELESKLEKEEEEMNESSSSDDEDLVVDDVEIKDKPRKSNPMVDDEAEESNEEDNDMKEVNDDIEETIDSADNDNSDNESSDESSSESEDEKSKPRRGRILKAFEDSDDESNVYTLEEKKKSVNVEDFKATSAMNDENDIEDDEIHLAQMNRSMSEDIFATQGSSCVNGTSTTDAYVNSDDIPCTADLGSQTFSIINAATVNNSRKEEINCGENLSSTQPIDDSKFDSFNKIRPSKLSQELLMSQPFASQSQEIGDDIAALCTGKFYDNPFVTQIQDDKINSQEPLINISKEQDELHLEKPNNEIQDQDIDIVQNDEESKQEENHKDEKKEDCNILQSILEELNEPEIEKQNKFFVAKNKSDSSIKKKFIIDSDEENDEVSSEEKRSKLKNRKLEKRTLQISDDEEEEDEALDEEVEESDIEDDTEKIVEYDSEENEIEVKTKKIKKHIGEFFENEAELTSEDEWAGSGDEDEAGPDRMEREDGDLDVFHQGRLQRELGQIHMREVLDQDKREVRLLQELLFEDGDLGDGHRQRKFRWKTDEDGEDEPGEGPIYMSDTQEEEFESEELWRKQRHEREVFLRSMQENEKEESTNTIINRTALIKANLNASDVTKLNETKCIETESKAIIEAKPTKDIPSPKKPFLILQQNYHGSLLSRGRGALARLAALATPLADDAPRAPVAAPANYVFATLSQTDPEAKMSKRKAETHFDTPRLLKKMKTQDTQKYSKNSLFDHFKT